MDKCGNLKIPTSTYVLNWRDGSEDKVFSQQVWTFIKMWGGEQLPKKTSTSLHKYLNIGVFAPQYTHEPFPRYMYEYPTHRTHTKYYIYTHRHKGEQQIYILSWMVKIPSSTRSIRGIHNSILRAGCSIFLLWLSCHILGSSRLFPRHFLSNLYFFHESLTKL